MADTSECLHLFKWRLWGRELERERETERQRQTDRQRETERESGHEREKESESDGWRDEGERSKETGCFKDISGQTLRQTNSLNDTDIIKRKKVSRLGWEDRAG